MAANIRVVSFGVAPFGLPSTNAYLLTSELPLARDSQFVEAKPFGKHPVVVNRQPVGQVLPLHIDILAPFDNPNVSQDLLMRFFEPGTQGTLVVRFDTVDRQVEAWVQRAIPHSGSSNRMTVLLKTPDPRWRSVAEQTSSATFPDEIGQIVTDDTRETNDEGDGLQLDGTQGIYRGSTNLLDNSSIETNDNNWVVAAGNLQARETAAGDSAPVKFGLASLRVTMNGINANISGHNITLTTTDRHAASVWIWLQNGWDGGDVTVTFFSITGTMDQSVPADGTITGKWQKVIRRLLPDGVDQVGFVLLRASSAPTSGLKVWIDGAQCEEQDWPTPHILTDGSTESRTAAALEITDVKMDEEQGAVAMKIRHNWKAFVSDNDRYLFTWKVDVNRRIQLWHDAAAQELKLERLSGGAGSPVSIPMTGDFPGLATIVAAWTATELKLARDGDDFTTQANTNIPDLSPADIRIGDDGVVTDVMDSELFWCALYGGTLDNDDVDALSANANAPANRMRATRDLTRRVWTKIGTGTAATRSGSAQDVINTVTLGGRGAITQLAEEDFVANDVWKFSVTLSSRLISTWTIKVGDEFSTESTSADVRIGRTPTRHSVSHTFSGSGTGVLVSLVNGSGTAKTGDVSDPTIESTSSGGGDITISPGAPQIANPPGGQFTPPGGVQDAGDIRVFIPGPKQPDDIIEVIAYNGGNADDDQAVIRITPRQNKDSADWWTRAAERIVANRSTAPLNNYTIDVTGGGVDHAALVSASQALANGNDFRVLVDGVEVPRWEGGAGFNTATLLLWVNFDLAGGKIGNLDTAMTASSSVGDLMHFKPGEAAVFDDAGFVLAGSECIEYEGKTSEGLLVKTRGTRNTTAATHAIGVSVYWVEKRVQIIYDYDNAPAPDDFDELEPLIDRVNSTNTSLVWANFRDFDKPARSMGWGLQSDERDRKLEFMGSAEDIAAEEQKLECTFAHDRLNSSLRPGNRFERNFPVPFKIVAFTLGLQEDIILDLFSVDDKGQERLWRTFHSFFNGLLVSNDLSQPPPTGVGSLLSTLGFRFRSWMIARSLTSTGSTSDSKNDLTVINDVLSVPVVMPERIGQESTLSKMELKLSTDQATPPGTQPFIYYAVKDADDNLIAISDKTQVVVSSITPTPELIFFNMVSDSEVNEGDQIYIVVEEHEGDTITWYGFNAPYLDQETVQHFKIYSEDMHPATAALADDLDTGNVSAVTITLETNLAPQVTVTGGIERYFLNATIANDSTGQEIVISTVMEADVDNVVEIDMKNRTVLERDGTNAVVANLLPASSFSDPDDWITIKVDNNNFTYAEPGLKEVDFDIFWHNVWS